MRSPSRIRLRVTFSPVKPKFVVTCTSTRERARQEWRATVREEEASRPFPVRGSSMTVEHYQKEITMTPSVALDLTPAPQSASPSWISFTVTAQGQLEALFGHLW